MLPNSLYITLFDTVVPNLETVNLRNLFLDVD